LKTRRKNQIPKRETISLSHRTCPLGKQRCISPATHRRCDAYRLPVIDSVMGQGSKLSLVFAQNLQLSSVISAEP